ncbi:MAG: CDP-alcohol phosphatidyltransferase family protein [Candidatus Aminicenantes bacterium]|nr:CDP-alcohol phosphatidyltransferase family protein [Candidatus Aminicenantes bacterium]
MKKKIENNAYKKNKTGYILVQVLTLIRIPLAILFAIFLLSGRDTPTKLIITMILLVLIETTDAVDGKIARFYQLVSEYGATLDPFADSISRLIVYWALASHDLILFLVPLCMAVRDITVAYSRILLAQRGQSVSARISGKIKAIFQASLSPLILLSPYYLEHTGRWPFYALSWLVITVTLLSAVQYVRDAIVSIKNSPKDQF